jgi:glycosyltransferase involved in cell wall biosynthesis
MRILFVVSSSYWITAVEAREIMRHNRDIRGVLCSVPVLDELLERAPYLAENIDLVHFMVPVAGRRYLDRFLGRFPCVTTIHHIEPSYAPEAISINSRADNIMIVSEMWRSALISRGVPADRIFLMPNGVDTRVFRPPGESERSRLRHSMGFTPDEVVIGFSGQPGRDNGWRKGLDVFIYALKILVGQGLRIAVVVGGPGWGTAIAKIRAMGIKVNKRPYVLIAEDGAPMYRALDFFWVTSRIEGGPVPLMEAMSSGVCCISTKVGIAPEVIQDGINGCLVDIEDAPRIAALTSNLMDSLEERERMGREARSTIVSEYDWSKTAKQASLLYNTAMINFERCYSLKSKQNPHLRADHSQGVLVEAPIDDGGGSAILSPRDAQWLEAQEQLLWARELCRMGERRAALGLGWRACLTHPFSIRTWSFLANLVMSARALELGRSAVHRLNGS